MRCATIVLLALLGAGCNDLHSFEGTWRGPRVGESPVLRVGVRTDATARLEVDSIDAHGIRGHLTVDGLILDSTFQSLEGAEADALAGISFQGSPLRVYLSFVSVPDGGGEALAVIALFDHRVELRLLRGGSSPLYAIFALAEAAA